MSISIKYQISSHSIGFTESYHTAFAMPEYMIPELSHYKLLKWQAGFFLNQWERNVGTYAAGTIRRFNEIFHVNLAKGLSIGKLKTMPADTQLSLSFRKAPNMPAIVIISLTNKSDSQETK